VRVVAAPDKFRGTATARQVAAAIGRAVAHHGGEWVGVPMADGGEGTLEALGGPNRRSVVMGPLGDPVEAGWRFSSRTAVLEMAGASGIALVGGADGNDPMAATTHGTGELISLALDAGARRIVVGVGGSATTDGGLGAVRAVWQPQRLRRVELVVACDVRTTFVDAAEVFAPQKGASPAQVQLLKRRLERLAQLYREEHGVDVTSIEGSGAAGGLAGGLAAAFGAHLVPGVDLVGDELGLAGHVRHADLVVTGEGFLDQQSFDGKVVGGVAEMAAREGVPAVAVVGEVLDGVVPPIPVVSLVERFGHRRAMTETEACVEAAVDELLAAFSAGDRPSR
jgi:glycerate 2-kinase